MYSEAEIAECVRELAARICADYGDTCLTLLVVLKGGAWFAADLARRLPFSTEIEFTRAKSYRGAASTGEVSFLIEPGPGLAGRHVLIVEDILDTGHTLAAIMARVAALGPASLRVCTLLNKPARRAAPVRADYVGFEIPDHFVVGYGLDYEEQYRALPAIYTMVSE